jgi:uncharacterized FAD-dependent dehydrogenase
VTKLPDNVELTLGLDDDESDAGLREHAAQKLGVAPADLPPLHVRRRSIDARRGRVRIRLALDVGGDPPDAALGEPHPREVSGETPVVIVGDGPAGMFCAYELARAGVPSIVVDRGKHVQPRRQDLKGLNQRRVVDPDSNYCFGEGGAGTYSDGKLYTRAGKRGDVRDIYEVLALHGAPAAILSDARPHIGSNRLPKVVTAIRERLEGCGVVFRFGAKVTDLIVRDGRAAGVVLEDGEELEAAGVVLATGHSARDVWSMLDRHGVALEAKPFALGVRIEHPQPLIDRIQYGGAAGHPRLPAAAYRVAQTVDERGVFSFCMCPGGFVVPASTEPGALVVNGMSLSRRDSPFANSGLVVAVETEDFGAADDPRADALAGVALQRRVEEAAWQAGGEPLRAPAVRVTDFLAKRASSSLPKTSYQPGLHSADLAEVLDSSGLELADRLREALRAFERRMRGYVTEEATLIGVESRTSAPVRVPRDDETLVARGLSALYPCGEGAGYAGGIVSAALDGVRVARALLRARQPA